MVMVALVANATRKAWASLIRLSSHLVVRYVSLMASVSRYRGLRRTPNRQALLAAAEELFGQHGFGAVSVDQIVARAGVAKGTFYNHFCDKEDIVEQTALAIRIEVRDRIAALKTQSKDPAVHLAIAMTLFLELAVSRPRRAQILAALLAGATSATAGMNTPVRQTLAAGIASGRLQILSIDAAIVLVIGVVSAGISQLVRRKVASPRQRIIEIVVHALMGMGLTRAEIEADITPRLEALVLGPCVKRE